MRVILHRFDSFCLAVLTFSMSFALIVGVLSFREYGLLGRTANEDVGSLVLPAQKAIAQVAAAGKTISQIGALERDQFDAQQTYYKNLTTEMASVLASANTTVGKVNDEVIPRLNAALDATAVLQNTVAANVTTTTDHANRTIDLLAEPIQNFSRASASMADSMADPGIHNTLAHLDDMSGNLDASTRDVRDFIHRETTPVRGTWNVIKTFLRTFAGPAAQVATAIK